MSIFSLDKESIFFVYDGDFKETADELIEKINSDKFAEPLRTAEETAIPEFRRFNIIEREVRNVV